MLGCIQPMSSPMMNRMLGFCARAAGSGCACATTGVTKGGMPRTKQIAAKAERRFHKLAGSLGTYFILISVKTSGLDRGRIGPQFVTGHSLQQRDAPLIPSNAMLPLQC